MFRWHEGGRSGGDGLPTDGGMVADVSVPEDHEAHWMERLAAGLEPLLVPGRRRGRDEAGPSTSGHARITSGHARIASSMPADAIAAFAGADSPPDELLQAAFVVYLARITGQQAFDLGFADPALAALIDAAPGRYAPVVPMRIIANLAATLTGLPRDAEIALS